MIAALRRAAATTGRRLDEHRQVGRHSLRQAETVGLGDASVRIHREVRPMLLGGADGQDQERAPPGMVADRGGRLIAE